MSIFGNIFGSNNDKEKPENPVKWRYLTDIAQLKDISADSETRPVFIFKHSTRCSVSRMVLKQFESHYDPTIRADGYFLDLLEHREISNEIASQYGVIHQSPQLLLIQNGKCIFTESHSDIDAADLKKKVEKGSVG